MNYLKVLTEKMCGVSISKEQLNNIKQCIDTIMESSLSYTEMNYDGLTVYRYTDNKLSIVKTYLTYPDGSVEIKRSIVLSDDTQVYDDTNAIKAYMWYEHLISIYNAARIDIKSKNTRKRKKKH